MCKNNNGILNEPILSDLIKTQLADIIKALTVCCIVKQA